MTRTGFSVVVDALIRGRSGGRCEVQAGLDIVAELVDVSEQPKRGCVGQAAVHRHHRRNRGSGGSRLAESNGAANALHACLDCHDYIGRYPRVAYKLGWLVRHGVTSPAATKVLRRGEWCQLDDLGGVNPVERQAVI